MITHLIYLYDLKGFLEQKSEWLTGVASQFAVFSYSQK